MAMFQKFSEVGSIKCVPLSIFLNPHQYCLVIHHKEKWMIMNLSNKKEITKFHMGYMSFPFIKKKKRREQVEKPMEK